MKYRAIALACVALLTTTAWAVVPSLQVSLGTRETLSTAPIGGDGGASGSIEWVNLDGQELVLDGTWQMFTFDMDMDPLTPFTGNGSLDGLAGTIEHIRFRSNGFDGPITLWIDDVIDNIDQTGPPPPMDFIVSDFEGWMDDDEVTFQEPRFSGSTEGNLTEAYNYAGVDSSTAHSGQASYRVEFQFVDDSTDRWLRLTTFQTPNLPNPTIAYDQDSIVSFWIAGVPEPGTLLLLGFGSLALLRRR